MAARKGSRQAPLVLASGSPRRKELLTLAGLRFTVEKPDVDESRKPREAPERYVERLAVEKALAVAARLPDAWVIAADTTVALGSQILGKPAGPAQARAMLRQLSGKEHSVFTGFAVHCAPGGGRLSGVVRTRVRFARLRPAEIAWYAGTEEPYDKAGGYAIQGIAGSFITDIHGSYSNVVGLPVAEVLHALKAMGYPLPWGAR